jgi:hypothetical protein
MTKDSQNRPGLKLSVSLPIDINGDGKPDFTMTVSRQMSSEECREAEAVFCFLLLGVVALAVIELIAWGVCAGIVVLVSPDESEGKRLKCPECRSPLIFGSKEKDDDKAMPKSEQQGTASQLNAVCPTCSERYTVDASLAGKTVKCRACHEPFRIPNSLPPQDSANLSKQPLFGKSTGSDSPAPSFTQQGEASVNSPEWDGPSQEPPAGSDHRACPDCGKMISTNASQCSSCGCPLPNGAEGHSRQSFPPSGGAADEYTFLHENGIKITNIRLAVRSETYTMSGITVVKYKEEPPSQGNRTSISQQI